MSKSFLARFLNNGCLTRMVISRPDIMPCTMSLSNTTSSGLNDVVCRIDLAGGPNDPAGWPSWRHKNAPGHGSSWDVCINPHREHFKPFCT